MRSDDQSSVSKDNDDLRRFFEAVAMLADGDLTFGAPFDPATSAALGDNIDAGDIAQRLFDVTAGRDCRYQVSITALSPQGATTPISRTVVDTTVNSTRLLLALLDDVACELQQRHQL